MAKKRVKKRRRRRPDGVPALATAAKQSIPLYGEVKIPIRVDRAKMLKRLKKFEKEYGDIKI